MDGALGRQGEQRLVLMPGGRNDPNAERGAFGIDHEEALAAFDLLVSIGSSRSRLRSGSHTLGIDDRGRRPALAPLGQTQAGNQDCQGAVEPGPLPPAMQPAPDSRIRRTMAGRRRQVQPSRARCHKAWSRLTVDQTRGRPTLGGESARPLSAPAGQA